MSYCYNNNVSNCYTICKEVSIVLSVVKTSTTVTKVQLPTLFIHLSRPVYSFAFENFEEKKTKSKKMTKKRRDRKKMRIFEFRNRIRIFGTNTSIQLFEYPLTFLLITTLPQIGKIQTWTYQEADPSPHLCRCTF